MKLIFTFLLCFSSSFLIGQQSSIDNLEKIIIDYEEYTQSNHKSLWPEIAPNTLTKDLDLFKKIQGRLLQVNSSSWNETQHVNRDILQLILTNKIYNLEYKTHLFPLNAEGGFLTEIIYDISDQSIENKEDLARYIDKINALPAYFNQRIRHLQAGIKQNKTAPKVVVESCINMVDHFLSSKPADCFFMDPAGVNEANVASILPLVTSVVYPAYMKFKQFLQFEYLAKARSAPGVSNNDGGTAYYEHLTRYFTTMDITPKEVFEIGQKEVARIKKEMQQIIDKLAFDGDFNAFLTFLREDPQFYPKTPEELLHKAAFITTDMQGKLLQYFNTLTTIPLTVTPVPSALGPNYTAGRYSGGSRELRKPGHYWVNTYKLESRPLYALPALTLHEGVPGHHLQIMLAAEIPDVPNFRRQTYISAYGEGWGLYAEFLGKEAGIYKTDYEEFGRLTYEMWRACRLVVDPGIHSMGWTRDEAVEFMASNTALSIHEVNTEIDRYIGWPGQALSYKMGEIKIRALREKAEKDLGKAFDIRSFHDKVLENGSVPLFTLERMIDQWVIDSL